MTYIRFVVGVETESAHVQTGLFTEINALKQGGELMDYEEKMVQDTFDYYNKHLPVPPYDEKKLSKDAVAWFKDSANKFIDKMWDFIAILENNDVHVRILKTDKPGMIVYEDRYQILAKSKKF